MTPVQLDPEAIMLTTVLCCPLYFDYFDQIPELARYALGPLPESVCFFHFTMKNMTSVQLIVFFDCIIAARYVYIFWLKNPVAFKDEFWNRCTMVLLYVKM